MRKAILQNYLTTIFGILAGAPLLYAGSGLPATPKVAHILMLIGGIGMLGLGVVAKAFNTHSTPEQVAAAEVKK